MAILKRHESMNGAWIEAFQVGVQTDSAGITDDWTPEKIDSYLNKYNFAHHPAPLRIDHIEPDKRVRRGPAFGWVEAAKREGKKVLLKLCQVQPQFEEWVKSGMLKGRSIKFDPIVGIHHLAFLGYNCPAVKGMENVYDDGDTGNGNLTFEFADMDDMTVAGLFRRIRDFIIAKFDLATADQVIPDYDVTGLQVSACMPEEPEEMGAMPSYSEKETEMKPEEIKALITESVTAATQAFSEQVKALGEQNKKLMEQVTAIQGEFAEGRDAADRREFTAFCEGLKTRILPAEVPTLVDQLINLRKAPAVEFSEGDVKKTVSAVDDQKAKLMARAETIQFGEFATGDKAHVRTVKSGAGEFAGKDVDEDRLALHNKVLAYQEAHAGTSYETALAAVQKGGN